MGYLQAVLMAGGFLLLLFGVAKAEKKKEPIIYMVLGIIYIVLGAIVKDPVQQLIIAPTISDIVTIAALMSLAVFLAKAGVWVVSKTVLYSSIVEALEALKGLKALGTTADAIKRDYETVHAKELAKEAYELNFFSVIISR